MSFVKILGEMNRDTKRHTAFLQNVYKEAVKNPGKLKHLMPYEDIDASVEHLENSEEMLKKCLKTFVRLLNSAEPETDNRKVDALSALIESIKTMIGICQDLRWQVMIHEAQNEPTSENVCESSEEFLKKLVGMMECQTANICQSNWRSQTRDSSNKPESCPHRCKTTYPIR